MLLLMKKIIRILQWLFDPRELFKYNNWIMGENLGLKARQKFSTFKHKNKRHLKTQNKGRRE